MARTSVRFGFPHVQVFDGNSFSFSDSDRAALAAQAGRVTNDLTRITNFVEGLESLSSYYYPWKKMPKPPTIAQRRKGLTSVAYLAQQLRSHIKNDGAIGADRGALNQLLVRMRVAGVDDIEQTLTMLDAASRQLEKKLMGLDPTASRRRPKSAAEVHALAGDIAGLYLHHLDVPPTGYYKHGAGAFANILALCIAAWRDRPAGKRGGPTEEQLRGPICAAVAAAKARVKGGV